MFYKHWKKIALALTSFFWASCDNDNSPTNVNDNTQPSSSSELPESSSPSSSSLESKQLSSSSPESSPSSSNSPAFSSSSSDLVSALYGVPSTICTQIKNDSTLTCNDGVTCIESEKEQWRSTSSCLEEICPDYGVVKISEKTYKCDNGNVYNEAEFNMLYSKQFIPDENKKINCEIETIISQNGQDNKDTLSTITCDDNSVFDYKKDDNGNNIYTDGTRTLGEQEFQKKYDIVINYQNLEDTRCLYGPPSVLNRDEQDNE